MKKLSLNNSKKLILIGSTLFLALMFCFFNMDSTYAFSKKFDDIYYLSGGATGVSDDETVTYTRKEITGYEISSGIPEYYNENNNITNTCANVAGAEVIGFYDRYFTNFIPDFEVGYYYNGYYFYYPQSMGSTQVQNVINALYTSMGTNTVSAGTSLTQFVSGLTSYITSSGKSASYTSVKTNSEVDVTKLDTQYRNGYPVVLFCSTYNIIGAINNTATTTTLYKTNYSDNHIMLSKGYQTYKYFHNETIAIWKPLWYNPFNYIYVTTEVNFRTDTYVNVSVGWPELEYGYVKLYDDIVINSAYAVNVY